jgi:predicted DNA-binding transcriptional regulator AlpA
MGAIHKENETVQRRFQENLEREEQHRVCLEALLDEYDVAKLTNMSIATVRRWRLLRQGPRYLKLGSAVRYVPSDVLSYIQNRPSHGGHMAEAR